MKIAETINEGYAGSVAVRPARLASEVIFDTVAVDLGATIARSERAPMPAAQMMHKAS